MTTVVANLGPALIELEQQLTVLEPLLAQAPLEEYVKARLTTVGIELFRLIRSATDVGRLEAGAAAAVARDFNSLRTVLRRFQGLPATAYGNAPAEQTTLLAERIAEGLRLIDATEGQLAEIEPMEIGLRLELVVNRIINWVLSSLRRPNDAIDVLLAEVEQKLGLASEDDLQRLWAKITAEVQPPTDAWDTRIPLDQEVVDRSFFEMSGAPSLANRIARYLVNVRPPLVDAASRRGQQSFPFPPVALAQVLSWTRGSMTLSAREEHLAAHIMFLAFMLAKRMNAEREELAGALGVSSEARLINGQSERKANELVPPLATPQVIFAECRSALSLVGTLISVAREPEIELLLRFKLAAEVELPISRERFVRQREVEVQRMLCAFLIEQGTYAIGTKFGPAETDLVTGTAIDPLVIEVKLFKRRPTGRVIRRAFVQLHSYMDQAPFKSRGALLLLNLSDVPISAPREFIARVAVIAVNLVSKRPSLREELVEVRASQQQGEFIEIIGDRQRRGSRTTGARGRRSSR